MQFYQAEPTALTSWRLAILMGANSRTYKFALGSALLGAAQQGRDSLTIPDLAEPYAMSLVRRLQQFPQGSAKLTLASSDLLTIAGEEAAASLEAARPTERLLEAAVASMPAMVMQKFHNLRDTQSSSTTVEHTFYELRGKGTARRVALTGALRLVAAQSTLLRAELDARWSIVETSFDAGIGTALTRGGLTLSADGTTLQAPLIRRANVASARDSLTGFQHGHCFYCHSPLTALARDVHVDHVFPYAWMRTGSWCGPDLNGIWNLVVACATCNLAKSSRRPTEAELQALDARNEAIMASPHPLRRTLQLTMRSPGAAEARTSDQRRSFLRGVAQLTTEGGAGRRRS